PGSSRTPGGRDRQPLPHAGAPPGSEERPEQRALHGPGAGRDEGHRGERDGASTRRERSQAIRLRPAGAARHVMSRDDDTRGNDSLDTPPAHGNDDADPGTVSRDLALSLERSEPDGEVVASLYFERVGP